MNDLSSVFACVDPGTQVYVALDFSVTIHDPTLDAFLAALADFLEGQALAATVMTFTSKVEHIITLDKDYQRLLTVPRFSAGGADLFAVYEAVDLLRNGEPARLYVFTDGYFTADHRLSEFLNIETTYAIPDNNHSWLFRVGMVIPNVRPHHFGMA